MYRPVCYALFENERGESVIEPVVSFYDDDGPTGTTSVRSYTPHPLTYSSDSCTLIASIFSRGLQLACVLTSRCLCE